MIKVSKVSTKSMLYKLYMRSNFAMSAAADLRIFACPPLAGFFLAKQKEHININKDSRLKHSGMTNGAKDSSHL